MNRNKIKSLTIELIALALVGAVCFYIRFCVKQESRSIADCAVLGAEYDLKSNGCFRPDDIDTSNSDDAGGIQEIRATVF